VPGKLVIDSFQSLEVAQGVVHNRPWEVAEHAIIDGDDVVFVVEVNQLDPGPFPDTQPQPQLFVLPQTVIVDMLVSVWVEVLGDKPVGQIIVEGRIIEAAILPSPSFGPKPASIRCLGVIRGTTAVVDEQFLIAMKMVVPLALEDGKPVVIIFTF
jgi:hypothetical protein